MKQVLIVDDEKAFLLSLAHGLKKKLKNVDVLTAHNGKEAVDILASRQVDLVLTDLQMPVMNGFELMAVMNSQYPSVPVVVMTAFGTAELDKKLQAKSSINCLEKPLDLGVVVKKIKAVMAASTKGFVQGITLPTFVQLMEMEKKSCTLIIQSEEGTGKIIFNDGELIDAQTGELFGIEAAYEIFTWTEVEIELRSIQTQEMRRIEMPLNHVLMNALRIQDEKNQNVQKEKGLKKREENKPKKQKKQEEKKQKQQDSKPTTQGEVKMKEALAKLKGLDGFIAAGAFSAGGELLAEVSTSEMPLAEIGALANDVLLKAQKSTDIMGVGRGNVIHIAAPKANILVRCLNENTDFNANEAGRAHVHLVLVMEAEGNIALGKMQVEKVILQIAESVR